jgi:hypothetical protein
MELTVDEVNRLVPAPIRTDGDYLLCMALNPLEGIQYILMDRREVSLVEVLEQNATPISAP